MAQFEVAFSGNILPESSRDGSLENSSPIATAWSDRNFLGASLTGVEVDADDEDGAAFETASLTFTPYFSKTFENWTVEGAMRFQKGDDKLFLTNGESKIDESEFSQNLKISRRINEKVAFGFEYQRFSEDLDTDGVRSQRQADRFGPSFSQKLNENLFGV